uniref:Uncharacterized protein n=1 Tax=Rhizophora mucronata TaxID=61149 RepID=A0A2P2QKA6_RHIMU
MWLFYLFCLSKFSFIPILNSISNFCCSP